MHWRGYVPLEALHIAWNQIHSAFHRVLFLLLTC
jgi:hypothetical protein